MHARLYYTVRSSRACICGAVPGSVHGHFHIDVLYPQEERCRKEVDWCAFRCSPFPPGHVRTKYLSQALEVLTCFSARILSLVSQVMAQCDNISYIDYWNINVASAIMSSLANVALLFVFVYVLNSMLHKQFGNMSSGSKTVLLITIGVAYAVILADVIMFAYVALADNSLESNWDFALLVSNGLDLAYDIVWMIVVIISAAMSLSNVSALRSRRLPGGVSPWQLLCTGTFANIPRTSSAGLQPSTLPYS